MINDIIISPYITEKSMSLVAKNKYTFIVKNDAKKPEIIDSLNKIYKVHAVCIHVEKYRGKNILYKHRHKGKKKKFKKAIITLPKKEKIKDFIIEEK